MCVLRGRLRRRPQHEEGSVSCFTGPLSSPSTPRLFPATRGDVTHRPRRPLRRARAAIPVLTILDAGDAVPLVRALVEAGLPVAEVTLRTPAALAAMERIAREVPEAVVAAGTVTRPGQIAEVAQAGAKLIVTPGTPPALAAALAAGPLPVMPGLRHRHRGSRPCRPRLHASEVLPGRRLGRPGLAERRLGTVPRPPLLPDRRYRCRERAGLSRLAERHLRRRLLDGAGGGRQGA